MVDSLAGGGVDVRGQAPRGRRARHQLAILGAAHGDRAAGQVRQHRRSGQRRAGARRDRHPHVLADLHVQHEIRVVRGGEQQIGPERRLEPADGDQPALVVAGGQLPTFVELAVVGHIGLGHHTQHGAAVDDHRGVVHPVTESQRGADHQHRQQFRRGRRQVGQRPFHRVEQGVLQQDVLDRVAGQGQLGKHRQRHALVVAFPGGAQHRRRVGVGVGERRVQRAGGHADEPVLVDAVEVHRLPFFLLDVKIW